MRELGQVRQVGIQHSLELAVVLWHRKLIYVFPHGLRLLSKHLVVVLQSAK